VITAVTSVTFALTGGSAIAEGLHDVLPQLKCCHLLHNYVKNCAWKG